MNSDTRKHGSPYDRGAADSYYGRPLSPHWWPFGTSIGNRIEQSHMTLPQVKEYYLGYYDNESAGNFKDWGDDWFTSGETSWEEYYYSSEGEE